MSAIFFGLAEEFIKNTKQCCSCVNSTCLFDTLLSGMELSLMRWKWCNEPMSSTQHIITVPLKLFLTRSSQGEADSIWTLAIFLQFPRLPESPAAIMSPYSSNSDESILFDFLLPPSFFFPFIWNILSLMMPYVAATDQPKNINPMIFDFMIHLRLGHEKWSIDDRMTPYLGRD